MLNVAPGPSAGAPHIRRRRGALNGKITRQDNFAHLRRHLRNLHKGSRGRINRESKGPSGGSRIVISVPDPGSRSLWRIQNRDLCGRSRIQDRVPLADPRMTSRGLKLWKPPTRLEHSTCRQTRVCKCMQCSFVRDC